MKFKIVSVGLLLVCFVFLGILSGAIPVTGPAERTGGTPEPEARAVMADSAEASPSPTPTVSPTATPASTASARPSATVRPTAGAAVRPTARPASTGVPADMAPSLTAPPVTPTVRPTPSPSPTAAPTPQEDAEDTQAHLWEPEARVVSTTITWSDPLDNDTDYDVDGAALLGQDLDISLPAEGYQILIIHTHGTEAFTPDGADQYEATADYRTTDTDHTIVRVGQALADALGAYGLNVLLDTGLYDWPSYNGSYTRCEQAIREHLEANPGIAMVIDLHRDALGDDELMWRPVSDEADAAQIMFVIGTDENLSHPYWRDNLALAMSLQGLVEEKYPHLMRPTLLCSYRYNQQLTSGSVLMEIGAAGNTLQEAIDAAELFADAVGPALAARVGA